MRAARRARGVPWRARAKPRYAQVEGGLALLGELLAGDQDLAVLLQVGERGGPHIGGTPSVLSACAHRGAMATARPGGRRRTRARCSPGGAARTMSECDPRYTVYEFSAMPTKISLTGSPQPLLGFLSSRAQQPVTSRF